MMIKANDFRIGNFILFKEYGEGEGKIGQMKPGDFGKFNNEEYHTIPLTPDWLERMGFGRSKSDDEQEREIWCIQVANNTSLYYDPDEDDKKWYLSYEWNNNHFKNDFWAIPEYVHQVQNLFYSLAGEEIQIKETA